MLMTNRFRRFLLSASTALGAALIGLPIPAAAQAPQGVTDTEVLVGSHQDLSGPVAALGTALRDGLVLATEDINAAGGIHGRRIRLLVEDSGFDPKKAVLATQKLLTHDKVFVMIAPLGSATTQATMPMMLERGVPMLFAGTPADFTYTPFHKLKFGLSVPYGEQVRTQVKYAVQTLGKKRVGILYQDDETGHNVLRATEAQLAVHGMKLVERASYKRGEINFSSQISRLKSAGADVVILGTIIRETAAAKMEASKQGWPVDMMVNLAGLNSAVIKIGGDAVEGLYAMAQYLPLNSQEQTPELKAALERYEKRFGKAPDDGMIFGYVSMQLFAEGLRKAGRNLTAERLAEGLEQVRNFRTLFAGPPVSFSADNHLAGRATIVTQVRGGKYVPISEPLTYD